MIRLVVIGLLLAALATGGIYLHQPGEFGIVGSDDGLRAFIALELLAGLLWAAAAWLVLRRRLPPGALAWVLAVAAGLRVAVAAAPPSLSTDIYRYAWDGRVQVAGHNPYLYLPNAPELADLRDEAVYPHINRFDYAPTIYPPVAQAFFAAVAAVWPTIFGIKAATALLDAGSVLLLLALLRAARRPLHQVALYAWHPLPVWEFAGNGHIDGVSVFFIALAVLAAVRLRPGWAGTALAAAALCKFLPLALAPALWRRWDWRAPIAGLAVVAAGYAAYSSAGWRVLGFLPGYANEEGLGNGSGFFALRFLELFGNLPHWASRAYLAAGLLLLVVLGVLVAFRRWPPEEAECVRTVAGGALLLGAALIAVLSPHYPWYVAFLAWLLCLRPAASVGWLTATAPLLYLDGQHDQVMWPCIVYLPFALLALRDLARAFPRRPRGAVRAGRLPPVVPGEVARGVNRQVSTVPARAASGPGGVA